MHTPAGFAMEDGVFFPLDWWQLVFNPSFPYRLAHMLTASLLTGAFVVAGVTPGGCCAGAAGAGDDLRGAA